MVHKIKFEETVKRVEELALEFGTMVDYTTTDNPADWRQFESVEYRKGKGWYAISRTVSGWKSCFLGFNVDDIRSRATELKEYLAS